MKAVPEYHGPFGKQQAERLLWRAGFGARAGEAEALTKLGMKHAVHALTRPAPYQLVGPAPHDERNRPLAPVDAFGHDHLAWLDRMVPRNAPVREQARALTGWRGSVVNRQPTAFTFDATRHDATDKTIFGKSGNYAWQDSCQLCLDHPMHASYFVTKLWSYFIPTAPDPPTVEA